MFCSYRHCLLPSAFYLLTYMVNDPIGDFLVRLKNASSARKPAAMVRLSKMTEELALLLSKEGYVGEVSRKGKSKMLEVALKYADGRPTLAGGRRISKPSKRVYMGVREIKPVKRGRGIMVFSTPKGLRTDKAARRERVGGEALFELW